MTSHGLLVSLRPISGFKSVYTASSISLYAFNLTTRIVSVVFGRSMPIVLLQTKECCAWQIIICSFVTEKTGYKYWTKSLIKTPRKHQVGRMCSLPALASLVQLATNLLSVLKSNISACLKHHCVVIYSPNRCFMKTILRYLVIKRVLEGTVFFELVKHFQQPP